MHSSDAALDFVRRVRLGSCDSSGTNNSRSVLGNLRFVAMRDLFALGGRVNEASAAPLHQHCVFAGAGAELR
jgi:hypothetical protein